MKHVIKELNSEIKYLPSGEQQRLSTGALVTLKMALLLQLHDYACGASESLDVYPVATKVAAADNELSLDDADWALLKGIIEKNPCGFGATWLAQVWQHFVK